MHSTLQSGKVKDFKILSPGSGYSSNSIIRLTAEGHDFEGRIQVNAAGGIIDVNITNADIEELLWTNLTAMTKIEDNARATAIRNFNMALLVLLQKRQQPGNSLLQKRAEYFLDESVRALPDVEGFANDLRKIAQQ